MEKLPGVLKHINDSLDELNSAMNKVHSIYKSAQDMTPLFKQWIEYMSKQEYHIPPGYFNRTEARTKGYKLPANKRKTRSKNVRCRRR